MMKYNEFLFRKVDEVTQRLCLTAIINKTYNEVVK